MRLTKRIIQPKMCEKTQPRIVNPPTFKADGYSVAITTLGFERKYPRNGYYWYAYDGTKI